MKITTNTKKRKVQEFTYHSFIDYASNRKRSAESITEKINASEDESKFRTEFTETKSLKEAIDLAERGWDSGIKELKLEDGLLVGGNGMEVSSNVHGSMVNIGNYLQGLPNNMYEFTEKREFNLEPITIYTYLTYSSRVEGSEALKFAKSIIDLVNKYQSTNNIRIIGIFFAKLNGVDFMQKITIKDFNERFVINNIAFSFHPSFFRRLLFAIYEAEDFIEDGYGYPKSHYDLVTEVKIMETGKAIITPALGDLHDGTFTEEDTTKIN